MNMFNLLPLPTNLDEMATCSTCKGCQGCETGCEGCETTATNKISPDPEEW